MQTVTRLIALMGGLLLSAAIHADTAPFTITVPLELNNLPPEVTQYSVICIVQSAPSGIDGRGDASGRISGGSFRGDLVIPITLGSPFADPNRINNARCSLHLSGTLDGHSVVFMSDSAVSFPLAAGAPYRRSTGDMPIP